jgi:hypothetical protein
VYATDDDRLAKSGRPAKRVALRLALRVGVTELSVTVLLGLALNGQVGNSSGRPLGHPPVPFGKRT